MSELKCAICGKEIGIFERSMQLEDGWICANDLKDTGFWPYVSSMVYLKRQQAVKWGDSHSIADFKEITSVGAELDLKELNKEMKQKSNDEYTELKDKYLAGNSVHKFQNKYFNDGLKKIFVDTTLFSKEYSVHDYSDIVSYSPIEQGHSKQKKKHAITRTLAGGALLGGVGALAGAASSNSKSFDIVDSLGATVQLKDGTQIEINLVIAPKDARVATGNYSDFHSLCALLDGIINQNQTEQTSSTAPENISIADQLRELKSLVDDGIITQDDFDEKKKQLLNL